MSSTLPLSVGGRQGVIFAVRVCRVLCHILAFLAVWCHFLSFSCHSALLSCHLGYCRSFLGLTCLTMSDNTAARRLDDWVGRRVSHEASVIYLPGRNIIVTRWLLTRPPTRPHRSLHRRCPHRLHRHSGKIGPRRHGSSVVWGSLEVVFRPLMTSF